MCVQLNTIRHLWCDYFGGGHEYVYKFTSERISQECQHCGHESPGWQIEKRKVVAGNFRRDGRASSCRITRSNDSRAESDLIESTIAES